MSSSNLRPAGTPAATPQQPKQTAPSRLPKLAPPVRPPGASNSPSIPTITPPKLGSTSPHSSSLHSPVRGAPAGASSGGDNRPASPCRPTSSLSKTNTPTTVVNQDTLSRELGALLSVAAATGDPSLNSDSLDELSQTATVFRRPQIPPKPSHLNTPTTPTATPTVAFPNNYQEDVKKNQQSAQAALLASLQQLSTVVAKRKQEKVPDDSMMPSPPVSTRTVKSAYLDQQGNTLSVSAPDSRDMRKQSVRDTRLGMRVMICVDPNNPTEVIKRIDLTEKVSEVIESLVKKQQLPATLSYGLYLPSSGVWLDSNSPLLFYSVRPTDKLELRVVDPIGESDDCILLKVYFPQTELMKTNKFSKEWKVEEAIEKILQVENSPFFVHNYELFLQHEDGKFTQLIEGKKLSSYNLQKMDVIEVRRKPYFEILMSSKSVFLHEKISVSDAISQLVKEGNINSANREFCLVVQNHKGITQNLWLMNEKPLNSYQLNVGDILELKEKKGTLAPIKLELKWAPQNNDAQAEQRGPVNMFMGNLVLLAGEIVVLKVVDVCQLTLLLPTPISGDLFVTNYRLVFKPYNRLQGSEPQDVPVGSIYKIEKNSNSKNLEITTKDFRSVIFLFISKIHSVSKIYETMSMLAFQPQSNLFAFTHGLTEKPDSSTPDGWKMYDPLKEFKRMGVPNSRWRISQVNLGYYNCESYPDFIVLPECFSDDRLKDVFSFRSKGRIPALTYLHPNSASITRASQPRVGISEQRCKADEDLLTSIRISNAKNSKTLYVMDARPPAAALGNKVKGAGYENIELYGNCQLEFLHIQNIHAVRGALNQVTDVVNDLSTSSENSWMSIVESSKWLEQIKMILYGAERITRIIVEKEASVFVHCSDGWDRTSQLCSLAQLMVDPFFRTVEGFAVLIEKDWVSFGHQFALRLGHGEKSISDQRAPIFLQFLDCVWQLTNLLPSAFEFNEELLINIWLHSTSCRFGTFLFDNMKEREEAKVKDKTVSIWTYLLREKKRYINPLYEGTVEPLFPFISSKSLELWKGVYFYWHDWFRDIRRMENEKIDKLYNDNLMLKKQLEEITKLMSIK